MKQNKGITLIALVITIIVLLILAGVSISAIMGENGIVIKAKQAAQKTDEAAQKEKDEIQGMADFVNSEEWENTSNITPMSYTVTFKDYNGIILETISVLSGEAAVYPTSNPTRLGYTFSKWVTTQGGIIEADLRNVTSDKIVYATYILQEGMISFSIDGVTYCAEDTMCWDDWLESDYNTGEFKFIKFGVTSMNFYLATSNDKCIVDSTTNEKIYVPMSKIEDGLVLITQN